MENFIQWVFAFTIIYSLLLSSFLVIKFILDITKIDKRE